MDLISVHVNAAWVYQKIKNFIAVTKLWVSGISEVWGWCFLQVMTLDCDWASFISVYFFVHDLKQITKNKQDGALRIRKGSIWPWTKLSLFINVIDIDLMILIGLTSWRFLRCVFKFFIWNKEKFDQNP